MFPPLYAILDPSLIKSPPIEFAEELADAGVELIQIRHKQAPARQLYAESKELANWCREFRDRGPAPTEIRLIVNDRPDIAAVLAAGGVHVGQEDLPVEMARAICPPPLWVGVSTHNLEQLRAAARTSADYIAVGPIFPTATKENPDPVVGVNFIRLARQETRKPLVAIGGITIESAADIFRAGADSVAVVRDLFDAKSPAQRAREYLETALRVRVRAN